MGSIVASAIANINGYFKANISSDGNGNTGGIGRVLTAQVMRTLLKNTGTAQGTTNGIFIPNSDPLHLIGELPDIKAALLAGLPIADIKVNGSDGPITISSSTNTQMTANLNIGGLAGVQADWWVVIVNQNGIFQYFNSSLQWSTTASPFYQGGLLNISNYPLLIGTFSPGSYTLYFGVDTIRNGALDLDNALFYDNLVINVN